MPDDDTPKPTDTSTVEELINALYSRGLACVVGLCDIDSEGRSFKFYSQGDICICDSLAAQLSRTVIRKIDDGVFDEDEVQ